MAQTDQNEENASEPHSWKAGKESSTVENFQDRSEPTWCSSKPAGGISDVAGAFDSHTLPPIYFLLDTDGVKAVA
jgi:hypothetical protein